MGRLSHIIFFGEYDNSDGAGSLVLEDGRQFIEKGVWHSFDGSALLHWNVPFRSGEVGGKWSVVAWRGQAPRKSISAPGKAATVTSQVREAFIIVEDEPSEFRLIADRVSIEDVG